MRVYGTVVWWKVRVEPDGLSDLFRFKSVDWITPLNDDRALLSRYKLNGSATALSVVPIIHRLATQSASMSSQQTYHVPITNQNVFA